MLRSTGCRVLDIKSGRPEISVLSNPYLLLSISAGTRYIRIITSFFSFLTFPYFFFVFWVFGAVKGK